MEGEDKRVNPLKIRSRWKRALPIALFTLELTLFFTLSTVTAMNLVAMIAEDIKTPGTFAAWQLLGLYVTGGPAYVLARMTSRMSTRLKRRI